MLDIDYIRNNPTAFDANIARRGTGPQAERILARDKTFRTLLTRQQTLQAERNKLAKAPDSEKKRQRMRSLKQEITACRREVKEAQEALEELLITLPNLLHPEVPDGKDDTQNVEIRRVGTPRVFDFKPQEHFDIGENLSQMDFTAGVKLSGARFVVLRDDLARLHRALGQFMLDLHVNEHGFEEVDVPLMMRPESMAATTHLPKFDNGFRTTDGYWLIPSAEVPLINLYRDVTLKADDFPLRMTALTPNFRSEAGAAGRDTRGMIRMHQFYKVELVTLTTPERWRQDFDHTVQCAEKVLQKLKLPYRLMQLCAGDCATKEHFAIDPEVWLPGQNRYREVCTWACTTDYQTRRANIRYKDEGKTCLPYVIYGTGTATGRTFVAVLENYQQADGSVVVPEVLRPYMGGKEVIYVAESI